MKKFRDTPKGVPQGMSGGVRRGADRDRCMARNPTMFGGRGDRGVLVCCQRVLPLSPRPPYPTWVSREVQHHTMLRHDVVRKVIGGGGGGVWDPTPGVQNLWKSVSWHKILVAVEHKLARRAHERLIFEHIQRPTGFFGVREAGGTTLQLLCNYLQTTCSSPKLLKNPGFFGIPGL